MTNVATVKDSLRKSLTPWITTVPYLWILYCTYTVPTTYLQLY